MLREGTSGGYSRNDLLAILWAAGRGSLLGGAVGFVAGHFGFRHPIEGALIAALIGANVAGALTGLRPLPVTLIISSIIAGIAIAGGVAGATVVLWGLSVGGIAAGIATGRLFTLDALFDPQPRPDYFAIMLVAGALGALAGGWWLLRRVARWVARDTL